MKQRPLLTLTAAALLLASCGKDESKPQPPAAETAAPAAAQPKAAAPNLKDLPVPQGELPRMDPEKAKFIAVPSTPQDPVPPPVPAKTVEVNNVAVPAVAAPTPVVIKPAAPMPTEVKKAAEITVQKPVEIKAAEVKKAVPSPVPVPAPVEVKKAAVVLEVTKPLEVKAAIPEVKKPAKPDAKAKK